MSEINRQIEAIQISLKSVRHALRNKAADKDDVAGALEIVDKAAAQLSEMATRLNSSPEAREALTWRQTMLSRIIAGVTEGHLRLLSSPDDFPEPGKAAGRPISLTKPEAIRAIRKLILKAAVAQGHSLRRRLDLETAVSEAAMNALIHGNGGEGVVTTKPDGTVQIRISDNGPGIPLDDLPEAILKRGYGTTITTGHGFWLMLKTADRLWLLTGPQGTTVVIELYPSPPDPVWL